MSRISYMVATLATISLVACKPSPRYTLHEGTDPRTGTRCTFQINERTGEAAALKNVALSTNNSICYWEPIHDQRTAVAIVQVYKDATNSAATDKANAKQMQEIKAGTFTY
ncbi:MAG: hypothetical protein EBR40_09525 [Proteobacteria bacterium]|nr:hypothetical protein [Pseudomonadota bacterium]